MRRPGTEPIATTISLSSLSYGVVQTQLEDQATTLMIQDVGTIFPGCMLSILSLNYDNDLYPYCIFRLATIAVVKLDDSMNFCKTDEIGELILSPNKSGNIQSCYYGLAGISEKVFGMQPTSGRLSYIRTGLLGYVGPVSRKVGIKKFCFLIIHSFCRVVVYS